MRRGRDKLSAMRINQITAMIAHKLLLRHRHTALLFCANLHLLWTQQ
ncbi:Uncharacterised protein [Vibrio cholerae]|nr:Uncharacterised protein [Vibrio cholerae]